ncbi:MAG TPA: LytTR family DNA-binding domain-containing protein [Vicinamibacteria bacterium]|nr:LytTR family DNA-binding domain-containing protein [Vicinamibacteria bacterium]
MKIRVLIVDDEPIARERLRTLLAPGADVEIVGECSDGNEAVDTIRKERPDLVFLDVQVPELDGFGVVKALEGEKLPAIVFVTAYDQYALQAFEVHAVDYLLKPFDEERFRLALERARRTVEAEAGNGVNDRLLALLKDLKPEPQFLERVVVRSSGRLFFLRTDEIDWVESSGNYVCLHAGKESHLVRETMSALEARLDPAQFIRIHRTAIVRIDQIKELHPLFHGEYEVVLRDGTRLTLSRSYRDRLQGLLGKEL